MHDLTFANDVIKALTASQKTLPIGYKITSINAALSPLSHVSGERLIETYRAIIKGTELENIALIIDVLPIRIHCNACNKTFETSKPIMGCIACNSPDISISHIKEFVLGGIHTEESRK